MNSKPVVSLPAKPFSAQLSQVCCGVRGPFHAYCSSAGQQPGPGRPGFHLFCFPLRACGLQTLFMLPASVMIPLSVTKTIPPYHLGTNDAATTDPAVQHTSHNSALWEAPQRTQPCQALVSSSEKRSNPSNMKSTWQSAWGQSVPIILFFPSPLSLISFSSS